MTPAGPPDLPAPPASPSGRFAGLLGLPAEAPEPAYFADLQLDRLIDAVLNERDQHNLRPAFLGRLTDAPAIERRQSVLADLEDDGLRSAMRAFCDGLARCEQQFALAARLRHPPQAQRWRLNAVAAYAEVIEAVTDALTQAAPASAGMRDWLAWLRDYRADPGFTAMATGARALRTELGELQYTLALAGDQIVASPLAGQDDLGAATVAMFERFGDGEVTPHEFDLRAGAEMDEMQAAVLDLVVQLFPEVFARVVTFLDEHPAVRHETIDVVERELRFALAWLDFIAPVRRAGLPFCVPTVGPDHSLPDHSLEATSTFDVLLAHTLVATEQWPVTNDVALGDGERLLVVTGPNQGGKTTFARTLGQLYHLAALGLPVPGRTVALHPPDAILTHFERGDVADDPRSRLEEEVARVTDLLATATARSVVILNEMFSSTTWVDARAMSGDVLRALLDTGSTGVCVTFIDELSRLDPRIVSLVAGIDEHDMTRRTFEVARGRADGEAYAIALAAKHGLTHDQLRSRIEARA